MDLKAILEKNKFKIKNHSSPRKTIEIADEDRPYSNENTSVFNEKRSITLVSNESSNIFECDLSKNEVATINYQPIENKNLNLSQTEAKLKSNLSQTEAKLKPNLSQTEAKLKPNSSADEPYVRKAKNKLEPNVEPNVSQSRANVEPNVSQSRAKLEPKTYFSSLIGLQRNIVLFIHEICQTILQQETSPLSIEFISMQCQSPKSAVRKAIQRLEQKKIITRTAFKNGRGGWTQYQLPDQIYQEILMLKNQKFEPNLSQIRAKLEPNLSQTEAKLETKLETKLEPTTPSSSSYIKTTTTSQSSSWALDIEEFKKFGFNQSHLSQVISIGLKEEAVKQSLVEFSYDFDNKHLPKIQTSPVNLLMGLFRKGQVYISSHFQSEEEKVIQEMVKRAEERNKRMLDAKFNLWFQELSEEEKQNIQQDMMPSTRRQEMSYGLSDPMVKGHYLKYFMEQSNS